MTGIVVDQSILSGIIQAADAASAHIRTKLGKSRGREERGEAGRREEGLTDDLLDIFEDGFKQALDAAVDRVSRPAGVKLSVEFAPSNLQGGQESKTGADLAVRLKMDLPGLKIEKAVLLQAKRMRRSSQQDRYPELRERGEEQARKMLSITPASFFLMYNYGDEQDLFERVRPGLFGWSYVLAGVLGAPGFPSTPDCGTTVLPASRVRGASIAAQSANQRLGIEAEDYLRASVPGSYFFGWLMASCFVGDTRPEVVRLATPPSERTRASSAAEHRADSTPVARIMTITATTRP